MTMRRIVGWPEHLAAYVAACHDRPFAWGAHDCVRFAAGAVRAVTGCEVQMPDWRGLSDAAHALRAERGLVSAVCARLPAHEALPLIRRGDVVMVKQGHRRALAVCLGHVWAAPGADGLVYGPMTAAVRGWKVG